MKAKDKATPQSPLKPVKKGNMKRKLGIDNRNTADQAGSPDSRSNAGNGTIIQKNVKRKRTVNPKRKRAAVSHPNEDRSCGGLVAMSQDADISGEKSTLQCPQQAVPPDHPSLSVSEALVKLVSAVKDLFKQHSLQSMVEFNIHIPSKSDVTFQPKCEDLSEVQKSLQHLCLCLQDLQSLVDSELAAAEAQVKAHTLLPGPTPSVAQPVAEDTAAAERELSPPAEETEDDPDWSAPSDHEEEGEGEEEDGPEPPPAAVRRAARPAATEQAFVCTSAGCEQKSGVPRRFASEKSLRMHRVACHGEKMSSRRYHEYTCPLCGSVQKRPRELAAHIVTCQGRGEVAAPPAADGADPAAGAAGSQFIMCRLCHLCFPTGDMLRAHSCQYGDAGGVIQELLGTGTLSISGAELATLRRFICYQCREEFRNQTIYRVHLQFCRPPPYACELCGVELPCGRRLVMHKMSEHSKSNRPMFFCRADGCGLSFRRNAALQKHMIQRHSNQPTGQPYGCDVCDKKFIKKIYLTHHKLRYHHDTLQRDFVCDVSSGCW